MALVDNRSISRGYDTAATICGRAACDLDTKHNEGRPDPHAKKLDNWQIAGDPH